MKYEKVTLDKLLIVGIEVRTTNQDFKAQKDIGKLWDDFFSSQVVQLIPNRVSDDIYCIYTEYESDYTGEYTTVLGCAVSEIGTLTGNLVAKEIPTSNYFKFESEGKMPESVALTWAYIWKSNIERKYLADFDIYGKEASDPNNAKITTYLSIK